METQYKVKKLDALRHHQAQLLGVDLPEGISKRAGFESIFYDLSQPGKELGLCQWFVWCVYRHLARYNSVLKLESPVCEEIIEIASELVHDDKILNSIKRYDGANLRWFGNWTAPDGLIIEGGSKRTTAFKAASQALGVYVVREDSEVVPTNNAGCASVVGLFILIGYTGNMLFKNIIY